MINHLTRREFIRQAALASTGVSVAVSGSFAGAGSPNEKLNIALVGSGGRGASNLNGVKHENIVALCDVDRQRAADTFNKYPDVAKFADYRKMLDQMEDRIDAVVVSAPNHIHVPASVMAMRMGKHCYCEKPLAHSVYEARLAARVAAEEKVATQMGTQIHAGDNYRRVVELVRSGVVGPVSQCYVWLPTGNGGFQRPKDTPPVPQHLDWDLFLGPAPYRPYNPVYVPHDWHYWWDFGAGRLGNFGCHYMDLPFWALDLRHPISVEASGPPVLPESTPTTLTVSYQFPPRGDRPAVELIWRHGDPPEILGSKGITKWTSGILFVGSEGFILADYNKRLLWPEDKFADIKPPEPTIPESVGHHQEWINACKTGSPTTCNFDYSGALTETVLLGNVAYRLGRKIGWDAEKLSAPDCPEAGQYIQREYRKGWTL